jgi:hypothetical protein
MYRRCLVKLLPATWIRHVANCSVRSIFFCATATLFFSASAFAQTQPPQPEPTYSNPFGAIGQWVDDSISGMASGVRSAGEAVGNMGSRTTDAAKDAAGTAKDVAKEAAATVTRIPGTSVATGRERCPLTAGGGADCQTATVTLCRAKGYASGRSLDIQSGYGCPRDPSGKRHCGTESYVTRAMCQ